MSHLKEVLKEVALVTSGWEISKNHEFSSYRQSKQHHRKVLLESFHLNGQTCGLSYSKQNGLGEKLQTYLLI